MHNIITQLEPLNIPITSIQIPEGETLNSMWVNYGIDGLSQLLQEAQKPASSGADLEIVSEHKFNYQGKAASYTILGGVSNDFSSMRVALSITNYVNEQICRIRPDLYDYIGLQHQCSEIADKNGFDYNLMLSDINKLTQLLENYREQLIEEENNPITAKYSENELTPKALEKAMEFLRQPELMKNINMLLGQSGIVEEQANRQILYAVATSFKCKTPLHAMVQASSASGKSHLINSIAQCIPQEDLYDSTSFSNKAFYYEKDKAIWEKLIVIQDYDGLTKDAELAFRELQSNKSIIRPTVAKDRMGNARTIRKQVNAHFSSLAATTNLEVYLDNQTRSIMLGVDESQDQTMRIIQRQNQKRTGAINTDDEQAAKQLLRNCMRVLKPYSVVNYFADKLTLPVDAKSLRRLNEQFQDFICQITILHQFQRKTDPQGRLITTKEDVRLAVELFFTAIVIKVDELDASTRQFFDNLKAFVKNQDKGSTYKFTQREIRQHLKQGNTTIHKYIKILQELEYVQAVGGSPNTGYKYVISYWDNLTKTKERIKADLNKQLDEL